MVEQTYSSTYLLKQLKINPSRISGINSISMVISIKLLSSMLRAGLPMMEALQVLSDQSSDKKLSKIFKFIAYEVQNGSSLSEAMKKFPNVFTGFIVSVVRSGEQGGTLEQNLIFLADALKKEHELNSKIKGALMYPGVILGMAGIEIVMMIYVILPKLEDVFSNFGNLPAFTMAILNGAKFVRDYGPYILVGIVVLIFLVKRYMSTKAGRAFKDRFQIHFPVIKELYINNILATFARTLGILLSSGLPISHAVEICIETSNNVEYAEVLKKIHAMIMSGQPVSQAMKNFRPYFPESFRKLIEVGEMSGTLEENLMYLHDLHSDEVNEISNNILTFMEPILLIFIGVLIGGMLIAIVTPLYQFTSTING